MEISDAPSLLEWLFKFNSGWVFRGQAEDWDLEPNISRILPPGYPNARAVDTESKLLSYFRSAARHYASSEGIPDTDFAWMSLMQHYSGPTRLLDFTHHPLIALFFAFDGVKPDERSSVIWAFNFREVNKKSLEIKANTTPKFEWTEKKFKDQPDLAFEDLILRDTSDTIWITEPSYTNLRILRQGGTFLIKGNISKPLKDIIAGNYREYWIEKIEVPHAILTDVIDVLFKCGLSHQSVYPGLEGLGKDVKSKLMQATRRAYEATGVSSSDH